MTVEQFELVKGFFVNMPKLTKEIDYACVKCGKEQQRVVSGVQSFLA